MNRYFKPKSLTWWMGFIPLVSGVFMAAEPLHGMGNWVEAVSNAYDGATPGMLINVGLGAIGLRAAV